MEDEMPTFQRMGDEINTTRDHMLFELFRPQVLGCEILQWHDGVEIARGLLGEDVEFIVGVCFFDGLQH